MKNPTDEKIAWVILFISIIYFVGHFIVAKANGWDGVIDYGPSMGTDIEIGSGTRATIEDSGLLTPAVDVEVTDSEGVTTDVEVIYIYPDTGGPVQVEVYNPETNEYYELEMSIK